MPLRCPTAQQRMRGHGQRRTATYAAPSASTLKRRYLRVRWSPVRVSTPAGSGRVRGVRVSSLVPALACHGVGMPTCQPGRGGMGADVWTERGRSDVPPFVPPQNGKRDFLIDHENRRAPGRLIEERLPPARPMCTMLSQAHHSGGAYKGQSMEIDKAVEGMIAKAREHFGFWPSKTEGAHAERLRIWPANPANAFDTGAMLDLRVRMAHDLLMHAPIYSGVVLKAASMEEVDQQPGVLAKHALDLATALIELATERGLVRPLAIDDPESSLSKEDMARLTDQAGLMGAFNATNQTSAQEIIARFQRDKQLGIAVPNAPGSQRPS